MNSEEFAKVFNHVIDSSERVLIAKAAEYATADRLHNFKQAAHLQGQTPREALGGFMVKHTVSIYDMINSGDSYPDELWDEKIGDHINYLILLRALVEDEKSGDGTVQDALPIDYSGHTPA